MNITEPKHFPLKYFSHLSEGQKQKGINYLMIFANGLDNISYKTAIIYIEETAYFTEFIKNQLQAKKIFREDNLKTYLPLDYLDVINNIKAEMNLKGVKSAHEDLIINPEKPFLEDLKNTLVKINISYNKKMQESIKKKMIQLITESK